MDDITAYLITTYNADTVIIEGEDGPFKVKQHWRKANEQGKNTR